MREYTIDISTMLLTVRRLILTVVVLLGMGLPLFGQEGGISSADKTKMGEELNQFANRFLDWAVLSFATYTGQHEAELQSVFAKAKGSLENKPHIQAFLGELSGASNPNGLEQMVRDFTNQTGIGIYFLPQIVNEKGGFYVPIFNKFLAEGAKNPIAPYLIVSPIISGSNESGYQVSYTVATSGDLNAKKYNLDQTNANNPFHAIAGNVPGRKELLARIKPNLALGVKTLTANIDENFLPKLVITYQGNVYRPGEEIEMGMDTDPTAGMRLIARNRDGSEPNRSVVWSLAPQTVERKVRGSDLVFPLSKAGQWAVLAESGSLKATVGVKVVNFDLDWKATVKTLLYETLSTQLDQAQARVDSLEARSAKYNGELRTQLEIIAAANYPLADDGSERYSAYEAPKVLTGLDTIRFLSNSVRREGFKKLRRFKKHTINTLRQVNLAAFIDILIEDPSRFDDLLNNLADNSAPLIVEIVAAGLESTERDQKIKEVVINYLNANLEQLADAEFADRHYQPKLVQQAIPRGTSATPEAQDPNFYINPYAYFPGIEDFRQELKATLDTMSNPPFVVINYSQDLSTESYLDRTQAGKPKGIGDRPYKVYTVVNIPGSVEEQLIAATKSIETKVPDKIKSDLAQTDADQQPSPDLLSQALQDLYDNTSGAVTVFGYCKKCEDDNDGKIVLEAGIIKVQQKGLKCYLGFLSQDGTAQDKELYFPPALVNGQSENDLSGASFISQVEQMLVDEQAVFAAYQNEDEINISLFPCSSFIDDQLQGWNYCEEKIGTTQLNQIYGITKECLLSSGFYEYDLTELENAIRAQLNEPVSDQENFKVTFITPSQEKSLQSKEATEDYQFELRYTQDEHGNWKASLDVSREYLKSLGSRLQDPSLMEELIGYLDEIVRQSQVKFCGSEITANCTKEQLRLLQILNLNLQHVAQTGTLHPALWDNGDSKRDLIPESYQVFAIPSGALDGVIEDFLSIPLLFKTFGEMWINDSFEQLLNLFTKEGAKRMLDAMAADLQEMWTNEDKREHGVTKATVELAMIYFSWAGKSAKTLKEALEQADKLAKKLDNHPQLKKHLDELVKAENKAGIKKMSRLLDDMEVPPFVLDEIVSKFGKADLDEILKDLTDNKAFRDAVAADVDLVDAWKRLDDLGRAQMKKDPSILTSVRKAMDNPDIPSDKLDNIINKLAESGARCKTCDTPGKADLRFVDEVLYDLDGFATEFKETPGFNGFLDEMGQTGKKATGGSWTLDALMKNRSKYFGSETITGFEVKHVPGRDFAADVVSKNGDKLIYNEFKSWSSNLMGQSNMIDQMTGTLTQISNLDEMRFIFDANRWVPDAAKLKTALQGKSGLFDAIPDAKKLVLFQTIDTQEIINILADDEVFSVIFKVQ